MEFCDDCLDASLDMMVKEGVLERITENEERKHVEKSSD